MDRSRTHAEHTSRLDCILFFAFVLGIVLLPMPLGANRVWAVGALLLYFSTLSACFAVAQWRGWISPVAVHSLRVPLLVGLVWLLWVASYLLPVPCNSVPGSAGLAQLGLERVCRGAVHPDGHMQVLVRTILYLQIGLLTLLLVRSMRRAYWLLGALIASAALLATLGTLAALIGTGVDLDWTRIGAPGRASGPFVNPNHFAGYLELALGLGIGALVGLLQDPQTQRSWRQWLRDLLKLLLSARAMLRIALVVMVVALVTTQSRSGNVAFMSALLIGCVVGAIAMRRSPRKLLLLGASLIVVDLLIISSWFGLERLAQRVGGTTSAVVSASEQNSNLLLGVDAERTRIAAVTLDIWQQAPLRGHGGGGFRTLFPASRPAEVSDRLYDHAHNDYVQTLAEFGLLGSSLALLMVGGALWLATSAMRERQRRSVQGLALGCLIAIVSIGIHSVSDFNLQIPANAGLFTLVLALTWNCRYGFVPAVVAAGSTKRFRAHRPQSTLISRGTATVLALLCIPARAGNLVDECEAALRAPVVSVAIPAVEQSALQSIRTRRQANPKDELLRVEAARLAKATALRALALSARGQQHQAGLLEGALQSELHDTAWRTLQDVKARDAEAAMTLLLMVRLGMAEPEPVAASCAVLDQAQMAPAIQPLLEYERALCQLHRTPSAAIASLQQAARMGHVLAQETLGQLCQQAKPADLRCAVSWLCGAVGAGHGRAATQAAWLLQQHAGPAADPLVRRLYQRGADSGDAVSANNLGELLETAESTPEQRATAEHWYGIAAAQGLPEARLNQVRLWLERDRETGHAEDRPRALAVLRELRSTHPEQVNMLTRTYKLQL